MNYSVFGHLSGAELSGVAFKEHLHKKKIIAQLSMQKESTISELADLLNISVPKANDVTMSLVDEGLVKEAGHKTEGVGRKATIYTLNQHSCYFLGVEIKKYSLNLALMGFDKSIAESRLNIPFPFSTPHDSLDAIVKTITDFLEHSLIPKEKIVGMGLSVAGRINVKNGEILTIYHFEDAPVKKILEDATGLPVYIDNDSRTIAYGEYYFGRKKYPENVIVINLDYGLGTGIFVEGKPLYGASGYAGELGHIPLFNNEKICLCGKKGCMQTEASGMALIELITGKMQEGSNSRLKHILQKKGFIELEDVVEAVHLGDNLAIEGVTRIGTNLGKGLAVAINLFNPNVIVIGGKLSALGDSLLLPVIQSSIFQYSLSLVNTDTEIIVSRINEKAGLLGCCLLVRDKTLGLV
ncbi:ROK family protein [Panacibacter sp. DH6]|uniref:ROK family protein n=1 Tax=Panacibacter microcysteis TaxID=2793269 RepID=A0A931E421_9BACT|nr:ROK family protein [Panacibacter microcysteis]MBG9374900.1 ROK family protein [Panacibacter microcysteis]